MSQDRDGHDRDRDRDESPSPMMMRDIHALTPPISGHRSSSPSMTSSSNSTENFTTISREFNALVLAGSRMRTQNQESGSNNLTRIREHENLNEENNPLAIVLDRNPLPPPQRSGSDSSSGGGTVVGAMNGGGVSIERVKKEEIESKINAWQNGKIAKINNRFKRKDAVINGWEGEKIDKATSWMKKVERKIEEKRAKALEKMQNDIAKAHRKAEEKRATSEGKRGTKVAKVVEVANFMKAMVRPPSKYSFF
ncbi:hypothetical protein CDL12_07304 [Handroanthus impetiginosus]|uniref:Remorin C-terminal domain-containing protein n=1 Tax=Handroanthus impetiginosus TaxID=429701 RepID=A0A2G9HR30_9LAMI|nr:hypothetical protein CDL12_07304 [Handroanthus impetiginosus]